MTLDELFRLNRFELSLLLLSHWDELSELKNRLSKNPRWALAISDPSSVATMGWIDFTKFRAIVKREVSRHLNDLHGFGAKIEIAVCRTFGLCDKLDYPPIAIVSGIADALRDYCPENTANIIAVIVTSRESLRTFCRCP